MASIEKRTTSKGDRYRVQWREGGARDGQRQTVTLDHPDEATLYARLVDVNQLRMPTADQLRAHGLGHLVDDPDPAADAITVVDYCALYIDSLVKPRPEQIAEYRRYVDRSITPFFGSQLMTDVNRIHCREWQRWALREGGRTANTHTRRQLSPTTVGKIRAAVLYPAFAMSCKRQDDGSPAMRDWNPFDDLDAPELVRNPRTMLDTLDEARLLVRGAYMVDEFTGDVAAMLLASAFRWGELFGLTRPAVVPSKRQAEVRTVAARNERGRYELREEPKSDDGWRKIAYAEVVAPLVERRRDAATSGDRLLFPTQRKGVIWQHNNFRRQCWLPAVANAVALGLEKPDVTPHGLRHSTLTLLGEDPTVDRETLRAFAGHANQATTNGYIHFTGRNADAINTALDGFLSDVLAGTPAAA